MLQKQEICHFHVYIDLFRSRWNIRYKVLIRKKLTPAESVSCIFTPNKSKISTDYMSIGKNIYNFQIYFLNERNFLRTKNGNLYEHVLDNFFESKTPTISRTIDLTIAKNFETAYNTSFSNLSFYNHLHGLQLTMGNLPFGTSSSVIPDSSSSIISPNSSTGTQLPYFKGEKVIQGVSMGSEKFWIDDKTRDIWLGLAFHPEVQWPSRWRFWGRPGWSIDLGFLSAICEIQNGDKVEIWG